jgi:RNase H-like domain found in reverse transcriptase
MRLSTYENEFLALLEAVKKWRHYLVGTKFIIKTDQMSLKYLVEQRINHTMQHKGLIKLLGLDYTIEYKKRIENRREGYSGNCEEILAISELAPQWVSDVKESYVDDQWINLIKQRMK